MMESICDTCPLREGCSERIGLCNAYLQYQKRVERIRNQIESLNENKEKVTGRSGADKGGIQKNSGVHKLQAPACGRGADSVQPAAGTAEESEAFRGKEARAQKRADSPRSPRLLDGGQYQEAHRDV